MNDRPFHFDIAVAAVPDVAALRHTALRAEQLGYHGLVVADGLWLPAPFSLLAAAAASSDTLRLGTQVLAAPLRPAAEVAQQSETLDTLSEGRFRLGLGIGAPHLAGDGERLGRPYGSGIERRAQVVETIRATRERFAVAGRRPPEVLLAGIGPRLLELAAEHADAVALPVPYALDTAALGAKAEELRAVAAGRFEQIALSCAVMAVGDAAPPAWAPAGLRDLPAGSHGRLQGDARAMADELNRRRDAYGISRVTVPQWAAEEFAPVLELLADG